MLTKLCLNNFKCFSHHELAFRSFTSLVGRNNAGKSTIVEALRLVAVVSRRYRSLNYILPPEWTGLPARVRGIVPSLRNTGIDVSQRTMHRYEGATASVEAVFRGGASITVYISNAGDVFATVRDKRRKYVKNKSEARAVDIPRLRVLPRLTPMAKEESVLSPDYVKGKTDSELAPRHFRNHLLLNPDYYDDFCELAEATWPGIQITNFTWRAKRGDQLYLMVREPEFTAEAGWMGDGLQLWLQTIWFLAQSEPDDLVVLDEPDVYMHADVQRRLLELLRDEYRQVILSTHSLEMLSDVDPDEVLIVDRDTRTSFFADSLFSLQELLVHLHGAGSLQLLRLASSRKCLIVEGRDVGILKHLHQSLFPESRIPLDLIPNWAVGGYSGWQYARAWAESLRNAADERPDCYCLFDRDYYPDEDISQRYREAQSCGVNLHVWRRKELENYLVIPEAIARVVSEATGTNFSDDQVLTQLRESLPRLLEEMRDETFDSLASSLQQQNRRLDLKTANARARAQMERRWASDEEKLELVSGKALLKRVNELCQATFGVSFSITRLLRAIRAEEIPREIAKVLTAIEEDSRFSN